MMAVSMAPSAAMAPVSQSLASVHVPARPVAPGPGPSGAAPRGPVAVRHRRVVPGRLAAGQLPVAGALRGPLAALAAQRRDRDDRHLGRRPVAVDPAAPAAGARNDPQ